MSLKIIAAVVGLVVVAGAGYLFFIKGEMGDDAVKTAREAMSGQSTGKMAGEDRAFSGTFADLMKRGGSYKCDIAADTATSVTGGVFYVSGSDVRADTTSLVNGASVRGAMIMTDGYVYTWSDTAPYGVKVKVDASEGTASAAPGTAGEVFAKDVSYSWDCDPWTKDPSLFTPPSNIQFMDIEAMGGGSLPQIPTY